MTPTFDRVAILIIDRADGRRECYAADGPRITLPPGVGIGKGDVVRAGQGEVRLLGPPLIRNAPTVWTP